MKFKYYLRGIGIGILATTVIFMIAIAARGGIMTDEKAIARAQQLGYTLETEASGDATTDTSDGMTLKEYSEASNTEETTDSTEEEKTEDTTDASDTEEETTNAADEPTEITITISSEDDSSAVAKRLQQNGIIEDASDFDQYLVKYGYDRILQPGDYTVSSDMDYAQLAAALLD